MSVEQHEIKPQKSGLVLSVKAVLFAQTCGLRSVSDFTLSWEEWPLNTNVHGADAALRVWSCW